MNKNSFLPVLVMLTWAACPGVHAADPASSAKSTEYIDSVGNWGAWELGIEPSAGLPAVNNQTANVRAPNIRFRPNDNASYRPVAVELQQNMPVSGTPPAPIPLIPPGTAQGQPDIAPPTGDPRSQ